TLRRENDALIRRLDVLGSEIATIVKFDAFTQEERVRLAVRRNLPTVRQVWNDGLATITRVTPDQVVIHGPLCAHVGDGARLVHIKVRRGTQDAVAQDPTAFGLRFRRP